MVSDVIVFGAGGFIGGHLVNRLVDEGADVIAVDVKNRGTWDQRNPETLILDGVDASNDFQLDVVARAAGGVSEVYNLASDMGGIGFIETFKARCMLSVLITTNVLRAARRHRWGRVFFASSACVYPGHLQRESKVTALAEHDAYPADPEDGYGWEKLFGERMHRHFTEDFDVETRVARYHNVYGPYGTWRGGKEKAPAALCRKVAEAVIHDRDWIDVWGNGEQTRSFTYVDDAVEGTLRLMRSSVREPLNVGSDELVTVNQVIDLVESFANVTLTRRHDLTAPQGVRGRNSDNGLIYELLGWTPSIPLANGLRTTYEWVYDQVWELANARLNVTEKTT